MRHIFRCSACGKYTMKEACGCGGICSAPQPMKYSPDDRLAAYRRKAKLESYKGRGLL